MKSTYNFILNWRYMYSAEWMRRIAVMSDEVTFDWCWPIGYIIIQNIANKFSRAFCMV